MDTHGATSDEMATGNTCGSDGCTTFLSRTCLAAACSNTGGRARNEDAAMVAMLGSASTSGLGWAVVCDGMGGHNGGAQAAQAALSACAARIAGAVCSPGPLDTPILAGNCLSDAQDAVVQLAVSDLALKEAGAAIVLAAVHGNIAAYTHLGDCRLYLHRNGELHRRTKDDSVVQEFVDKGFLTEDQAANHPAGNLLTRCLGVHGLKELPEVNTLEVQPGDTLVLCSDGFWRMGLTDLGHALDDLAHMPMTAALLHDFATEQVIRVVNSGADDNVTLALVHIPGQGPFGRKTWVLNPETEE